MAERCKCTTCSEELHVGATWDMHAFKAIMLERLWRWLLKLIHQIKPFRRLSKTPSGTCLTLILIRALTKFLRGDRHREIALNGKSALQNENYNHNGDILRQVMPGGKWEHKRWMWILFRVNLLHSSHHQICLICMRKKSRLLAGLHYSNTVGGNRNFIFNLT